MAGHSEGTKVQEFCALRTDKCSPCNNQYQKNCVPKPTGWATYTFLQGTKQEVAKKFEAHHLLCVACVTEFIALNSVVSRVVPQVKWCVNSKKNMYAMPLWGHTIQWYCDLEDGAILDQKKQPKFKNIPMHDYDHNSATGYKQEVDKDLRDIANEVAKIARKNHEDAKKELADRLNDLSSDYKDLLKERGERVGGTHKAWNKGYDEPDSDWYLPFSMASDSGAEVRSFPAPGASAGKLANKINRLVDALGRWT